MYICNYLLSLWPGPPVACFKPAPSISQARALGSRPLAVCWRISVRAQAHAGFGCGGSKSEPRSGKKRIIDFIYDLVLN